MGWDNIHLNHLEYIIHKSLDEDFMFQLTKDEAESLSRCKNFTLNIKYLPYAFTEQGIFMLMTVLKGTAHCISICVCLSGKGMPKFFYNCF